MSTLAANIVAISPVLLVLAAIWLPIIVVAFVLGGDTWVRR
jgi:hypothetical protein